MSDKPDLFDHADKVRGLAHIIAGLIYARGGLRKVMAETAFGLELAAAAVILVLYWLAGVSAFHTVISLCLFLIVFAAEALNTAIEMIIDRISPEISQYGRDAKDLGSFAVVCLLFANGIFSGWAIWSALM